jgi:hypothetical protein
MHLSGARRQKFAAMREVHEAEATRRQVRIVRDSARNFILRWHAKNSCASRDVGYVARDEIFRSRKFRNRERQSDGAASTAVRFGGRRRH